MQRRNIKQIMNTNAVVEMFDEDVELFAKILYLFCNFVANFEQEL